MKVVLSQINFIGSCVDDECHIYATLPVRAETVALLADLLDAERLRRGTRAGTRALTSHDQAVLVLRWFCDATRMGQLAGDNAISESTGYNCLHEGIGVLAARAPSLHGALLAAKMAGHSHVSIDGTLIETDRVSTPGPTPGVDLWWSGKHANHGGNIQVITAPDGWPIWTSDVRPGREHDTTAVRAHIEILPALVEAARAFPVKMPSGGRYWTVLDHKLAAVGPADAFLRHVRFGRDGAELTTIAHAGGIALFLRWCLVEQSTGAAEQGDPPPHRRRRDLPNRAAIIRLLGAVLAEQTDEWTEGRRYMVLELLTKARLTLITDEATSTDQPTTELVAA